MIMPEITKIQYNKKVKEIGKFWEEFKYKSLRAALIISHLKCQFGKRESA